MEISRSWRGRIVTMGDQSFKVKLTPLRATPGGRHTAELPKSALSKRFRFAAKDRVLVTEFQDGSLKVTHLPWYRSPTRIFRGFLEVLSS
ncbi:hypothetical protein HP499_11440 [Paenarthrobacter sp. CM16]|uniref:hypothetical protein n=1 Tax=Paenarthrobacter sp. CM16 TaxID=2738447 RepID=UPI00155192B7|nr:hypothetical protein [Paenarthrobacter sp. CM16]NQD88415.1 hypothetical protein [Paenarthrobacter sp. CM16]